MAKALNLRRLPAGKCSLCAATRLAAILRVECDRPYLAFSSATPCCLLGLPHSQRCSLPSLSSASRSNCLQTLAVCEYALPLLQPSPVRDVRQPYNSANGARVQRSADLLASSSGETSVFQSKLTRAYILRRHESISVRQTMLHVFVFIAPRGMHSRVRLGTTRGSFSAPCREHA